MIFVVGRQGYKIFSRKKKINHYDQWIETYREEINNLARQIPDRNSLLSPAEIEEYLTQEILVLEEVMMDKADIERDQLNYHDLGSNEDKKRYQGLKCILIDEIGALQDPDPNVSNGINQVNKHHLYAMRPRKEEVPHFGVYYWQFVFLTQTKITVCGCFYDFILGEHHGVITDEFFFSDVVSISTKNRAIPSLFKPGEEVEVDFFKIGVPNNEKIQVALVDEKVRDHMEENLKEKQKARNNMRHDLQKEIKEKNAIAGVTNLHLLEETEETINPEQFDTSDWAKSINSKRSRRLIKVIRKELHEKKQLGK